MFKWVSDTANPQQKSNPNRTLQNFSVCDVKLQETGYKSH
jgi:hypothetical protein